MTKLGNIDTSTDTPLGKVSASDPVGSISRVVTGAVGLGAGLAIAGVLISNGKSFIENTFGVDTGEGFVSEV
jgi:hypothetical protein